MASGISWSRDDERALQIRGDGRAEQAVQRSQREALEKQKALQALQGARNKDEPVGRAHVDYRSLETLFAALADASECVRLLSAKWLLAQSKDFGDVRLKRRQDLPACAFLLPNRLLHMCKHAKHPDGRRRRAPIIAVSVPRTGAQIMEGGDGPVDPPITTEFLAQIGRALEENLAGFNEYGYSDVGVYLPWCSRFQAPRSLNEMGAFTRSQDFIMLWFAHALTTTYLCTVDSGGAQEAQSDDNGNQDGGVDGWASLERSMAWLNKEPDGAEESWPRVLLLRDDVSPTRPLTRPPPPSLGFFDRGGKPVAFASDDAKRRAAALLASAVEDSLKFESELDYGDQDWEDAGMDALDCVLPLNEKLRRLYLCGHPRITRAPESLCNASGLVTLFLSGCEALTSLPAGIGRLARLQTLYLAGCRSLTLLPESIVELHELRQMDLSRCASLRCLPAGFGNLIKLEVLLISGCASLMGLPESFPPLVSLHAAGCSSLTALPEQMCGAYPKAQLSHALTLDISVGGKGFPLRELCLVGCKSLFSLPAEIGALKSLTSIDLGLCESFEIMPPTYNALNALRTLRLHACRSLKSLPPLGALVSLTELDLSNCVMLHALPVGLASVSPHLSQLWLDGCSSLPLAVRMTSKRPTSHRIDESALRSVYGFVDLKDYVYHD